MSVALAHATSCIKTLKNAVRTIEAPLQRITSLAENLINIQVARTTLW